MCRCIIEQSLFVSLSYLCSLPLLFAFLELSPIYVAGHLLHVILYIIPSFLQFVCLSLLLFDVQGRQSLSSHVFFLKGSDDCSFVFICCPAFSTTLIFTPCFLITCLYLFCNSDFGVAGTKIIDL